MRRAVLVVTTLVFGFLFAQANPMLTGTWDGTIVWDAGTGDIALNTTMAAEAAWDDVLTLGISLDLDETAAGVLTASGVFSHEALSLTATTTFDIPTAAFTGATFALTAPLLDAELGLGAVLEPNALGMRLALTAAGDSVIRSLSIGFNLDAYGRIQTTSCTLPFSCAEAQFAIPLEDCETTIDARIRLDCAGFSELTLSAPHVGDLPFAISLSSFLTFALDEKVIHLSPSLNLENPDCFDFYAGMEWDAASNTLSELLFYGMGVRCDVGDIQLRMLYALDPNVLALVKSPYRSLLGLVRPMPGCCGVEGEGSLVFFFGTDNLFDLGEINAELILPATETLMFSLAIEFPMTSTPVLTFGWQFRWE